MASHDAARWYVISLRPQGGHASLRRLARRHGAGLLALSPWRLQSLDGAAARAALARALAADVVLFTSPAAVVAARRLSALAPRRGQLWTTVGAGTAAALHEAGVDDVLAPARMDSEGLLALPPLQDLHGRSVGLVTAPGGRGLIARTLADRGASIRRAEVYRRLPLAPSPRALARLRALQAPAVLLLSSGEALDTLLRQLPADAIARLRALPVIAASARLADQARALGFAPVSRADGPQPGQLFAAAAAAVTPLRLASDSLPTAPTGTPA
ncbi:uroporphyrinogen-III synthase [Pseudoxanthomonas mexicana]|uniref:uroporphyrinogen-III synthase n=1 Tax=Pseudoxanthomonas mexicana TaxID=128785 RepID=UPI00398A5275